MGPSCCFLSRGLTVVYSDEEDQALFGVEHDQGDSVPFGRDPIVPPGSRDPAAFPSAFVERYGHDGPQFLPLEFAEAAQIAGDSCKPLLLYLHDDSNIATNIYCSQVLCSRATSDFINHNFVPWGCDMTTPESRRVVLDSTRPLVRLSRSLSASYPCLAVVVRSGGKWQVVKEVTESTTVDEVVAALVDVLGMAEALLVDEKAAIVRPAGRCISVVRLTCSPPSPSPWFPVGGGKRAISWLPRCVGTCAI